MRHGRGWGERPVPGGGLSGEARAPPPPPLHPMGGLCVMPRGYSALGCLRLRRQSRHHRPVYLVPDLGTCSNPGIGGPDCSNLGLMTGINY